MKLLHVDASARSNSVSRRVSAELVSSMKATGSVASYCYRDLARHPVPHITAAWTEICDNLMIDEISDLDHLHRGARTREQKEAWRVVAPLLEEVVAADVVVVATPMYNFSIPSSLKAWLDQITFPRMDLRPRRFVIVASRGGAYGRGTPRESVEHQVRYLDDFLQGHFAVAPPAVVAVEMANSLVDPKLAGFRDSYDASLSEAFAAVRSLAVSMQAAS